MSQAFDESGQLIQLGTKLGEGGEGVVFDATHAGQSVAAKIYSKALPPEHQAKLRTMSQIGDTYLKEMAHQRSDAEAQWTCGRLHNAEVLGLRTGTRALRGIESATDLSEGGLRFSGWCGPEPCRSV
jgi:hypothetical protein